MFLYTERKKLYTILSFWIFGKYSKFQSIKLTFKLPNIFNKNK